MLIYSITLCLFPLCVIPVLSFDIHTLQSKRRENRRNRKWFYVSPVSLASVVVVTVAVVVKHHVSLFPLSCFSFYPFPFKKKRDSNVTPSFCCCVLPSRTVPGSVAPEASETKSRKTTHTHTFFLAVIFPLLLFWERKFCNFLSSGWWYWGKEQSFKHKPPSFLRLTAHGTMCFRLP